MEGMKRVLTGVLAGAVHSRHPGTLLSGGGLLHGHVDDVDQSELLVVPQHISIDVIIDAHALCVWGGGGRTHNRFSISEGLRICANIWIFNSIT